MTRYEQIIERNFQEGYKEGLHEVFFRREDLTRIASDLGIDLPKNLGDVVYSFRYRAALPESIRATAPEGQYWIIRPAGKARYCFALTSQPVIVPNAMMVETKIPDSTPGVIMMYAFDDEQGMLAKLRYNRLVDVFTGVTCYSLQNHLRTSVPGIGQVETDELYIQ